MTFVASALLSAAFFAVLVSRAHAAEGFLAPCRADSDCRGSRQCRKLTSVDLDDISADKLFASSSQSCDDDAEYCMCIPVSGVKGLTVCNEDDDCEEEGESCWEGPNVCAFQPQIEALEGVEEKGQDALCLSSKDCSSDRQCVRVSSIDILPLSICLAKLSPPPSSAEANGDGNGEGTSDDGEGGDSSEVCIAAQSLSHLAPHELLYTKHVSARVLCDAHQSCATAGHMVRYRGEVMMMKTYCARTGGCTRSIMLVNSPRYRRALQIASDTPHLAFTALAARYGTSAEEHVLRTAVRFGL